MPRWFVSMIGGVGIALLLGAAVPAPALAADRPGSIRIRVGPAIPLGGTSDEFEPAIGVEWDAGGLKLLRGGQFSIGADWVQITHELPTGRLRNASLIPVLLNARWPSRIKGIHDWGFGLGVTFVSDDIPQMGLTSTANFAWQAFLGHNFNPRFRGDLRFVSGDDPGRDGLVLIQVGYRL